ncbi:MAG: hypothetical protein ACC657_07825 [Thiohalomonadales bacterium]
MMNKIVFFVISIFLISCGGGDNNVAPAPQVNCINNISTGNPGTTDNIDMQILKWKDDLFSVGIPMEGVVVQLDNDGVCVKSNSEGFVTFSALSNGEHDIHIFSPEGYMWRSIYNLVRVIIT